MKNCSNLRIIGGKFRSRQFRIPMSFKIRPTLNQVRENLFNWLGRDLDHNTRCLDAFAGSGSLGLESLSRGVAFCTFVDLSHQAISVILKATSDLRIKNFHIMKKDVVRYLSVMPHYDIIFLDPPFGLGMLEKSIKAIVKNKNITQKTIMYIESDVEGEVFNGIVSLKQSSLGRVHYSLARKKSI